MHDSGIIRLAAQAKGDSERALTDLGLTPDMELPDGRVLALVRASVRPRHTDTAMELPVAHLFTLRDGLVTRFQIYSDRRQAREAAGLEESG
jgi:ketosteroid isomerase-like protein